jgi:hypothetical protein
MRKSTLPILAHHSHGEIHTQKRKRKKEEENLFDQVDLRFPTYKFPLPPAPFLELVYTGSPFFILFFPSTVLCMSQ